jgi:broad specificity phosphatase PhoE
MGEVVREIYLIRHGETDFNKMGIVQGRGVNSFINEAGEKQAQAFFEHFGHIEFDAVFASTLQRTQQTLKPFVEKGHKLIIHESLDEIDWGIHEGKISDHDRHNEFHRILADWRSGILDVKIPGGESPLDLQQRQLKFLNEVLPQYKGKILICSHGRAMRSLLCTMLNMSLAEMDTFPHTNLSLYHLSHDNKNFKLEKFNYTDHLNRL